MAATLQKPLRGPSRPGVDGLTATAPPPTTCTPRFSRRLVTSWIAIAVLVAAWQVAPEVGLVDPTFLPPFDRVVSAWWRLAASGELWADVEASLRRSLSGFGIALGLGIPLGLVIGWYPLAAELLSPLFAIFLNTAAIALLPVFTLILGIGETSKVSIIVYASVWPILYNTISGVRSVDPLLIKSARSLGVGQLRLFHKVILPAAVPTIFTGARLAGAASILVVITAEMVGARAGLGYLILNSQFNFQIPQMYAGILTVSAIGVGFNYLLSMLERRVSTWRTAS